ncbi:hypothetical protein, partial [Ochrobactrum soli]|uniref:hypothetical protein n=1 Tax=Ochrobactrum soli TaxID=2448455 RepID=UPI001AECD02A
AIARLPSHSYAPFSGACHFFQLVVPDLSSFNVGGTHSYTQTRKHPGQTQTQSNPTGPKPKYSFPVTRARLIQLFTEG